MAVRSLVSPGKASPPGPGTGDDTPRPTQGAGTPAAGTETEGAGGKPRAGTPPASSSPAGKPAPPAQGTQDDPENADEGAPGQDEPAEGSEPGEPEQGAGEEGQADPPDGGEADPDEPGDELEETGFTLSDEDEVALTRLAAKLKLPAETSAAVKAEIVRIAGGVKATLGAAWERRVETWAQQAQQRFGDRLPQVVADANTMLARFWPKSVWASVEKYGFGNDPDFLEGFSKLAQSFRENRRAPAGAGADSPKPKTREQRLYTKSAK